MKKKVFCHFQKDREISYNIYSNFFINRSNRYLHCIKIIYKTNCSLANKVRNSNPSKPVNLDKINISEIDELSSAIELLSANVADSSSKLSQIIEMVDMPIGLLSYTKRRECFFVQKIKT